MDGMRRLEGRRALVTGSATGIGRSTVIRLTSEGAAAVVNYVGPPGTFKPVPFRVILVAPLGFALRMT